MTRTALMLCTAALATSAWAQPVTFKFTGTVTGAPDLGAASPFDAAVAGDAVDLRFEFDPAAPPTAPFPTLAEYEGVLGALSLAIDGVTVNATAGDLATFKLSVQDASFDSFVLSNTVSPPDAGFRVSLQLLDFLMTAFSTTALPSTLDLADFGFKSLYVFEGSTALPGSLEVAIDAFEVVETGPVDSDGDGLTDDEEDALGTDPNDTDTDDDGIDDFTEVDMADGGTCPDPLAADSDGDNVDDGDEVTLGTDTCNVDSDGDSIPDDIDPLPTNPEGTEDYLATELRVLSDGIALIDLGAFAGSNQNRARGRRNALSHKAGAAANAVAGGDIVSAIDQLESLLAKIDDAPQPPDWLAAGAVKDDLRLAVEEVLMLLAYLE